MLWFWAVRSRTRESVFDLPKINLNTPLLAAEGFMILKIQIQMEKNNAISTIYCFIADHVGEFA